MPMAILKSQINQIKLIDCEIDWSYISLSQIIVGEK